MFGLVGGIERGGRQIKFSNSEKVRIGQEFRRLRASKYASLKIEGQTSINQREPANEQPLPYRFHSNVLEILCLISLRCNLLQNGNHRLNSGKASEADMYTLMQFHWRRPLNM